VSIRLRPTRIISAAAFRVEEATKGGGNSQEGAMFVTYHARVVDWPEEATELGDDLEASRGAVVARLVGSCIWTALIVAARIIF
jgi:hypothetical protein